MTVTGVIHSNPVTTTWRSRWTEDNINALGGAHPLRGPRPAEAAGRAESIGERMAATNKGKFSVLIAKLTATEDSLQGAVGPGSNQRFPATPGRPGGVKVAFQSRGLDTNRNHKGTLQPSRGTCGWP